MGLDAGVRCRCWEEGKTKPFPFSDLLSAEDAGLYPIPTSEERPDVHQAFWKWRDDCCDHPQMWLAETRIANWAGLRDFFNALDTIGAARFPRLRAEIPDFNGGLTQSPDAQACLAELDDFASVGAFGSQTWLIDAENGQRIYNYIAAYEGAFAWGDGCELGVDPQGFYLRKRNGRHLFRSMAFDQQKRNEKKFELRDRASRKCVISPMGVRLEAYPASLRVETVSNDTAEYARIIANLRTVFEASVSSGNPVVWL